MRGISFFLFLFPSDAFTFLISTSAGGPSRIGVVSMKTSPSLASPEEPEAAIMTRFWVYFLSNWQLALVCTPYAPIHISNKKSLIVKGPCIVKGNTKPSRYLQNLYVCMLLHEWGIFRRRKLWWWIILLMLFNFHGERLSRLKQKPIH